MVGTGMSKANAHTRVVLAVKDVMNAFADGQHEPFGMDRGAPFAC